MTEETTKYSVGKGIAAFFLWGLLGLVWSFTSVPIIAGFVYIVAAPLIFSVGASWWMVNVPVSLVFCASLWLVHKIIARPPANATQMSEPQSATDAVYGTIGFALFYLVAWWTLVLFVKSAAPL